MTISYTRSIFSHIDWINRVNRVQAGGDNGFNGRFHGIEAEFDTISGVVGQVSNQFGTLATQITDLQQQISALGIAVARAVSVAPVLTAVGPSGWDTTTPGVARKPPGATSAFGAVTLTLPAGAQITAFRALGNNTGSGTLRLDLTTQGLNGQGQAPVVRISVTGQAADNPFDITKNPVSGTGNDVINAESSYFILARLDSAGANNNVFLTGFQVLYRAR